MPQTNKSTDKFKNVDITRKHYQEAVSNEFNDVRTQVINRLFDQSALYNDEDYKLRPSKSNRMGDTVVNFNIQNLINDLKNEVDNAMGKLPSVADITAVNLDNLLDIKDIEIQDKYNKVISSISSLANAKNADADDINTFKKSVTDLAPSILLLIQHLFEVITLYEPLVTLAPPARTPPLRKKLDSLYTQFIILGELYKRLKSGYTQGQEFELKNLASVKIPKADLAREALQVHDAITRLPAPAVAPVRRENLIPVEREKDIVRPPAQDVENIPVVASGKSRRLGVRKEVNKMINEFPHQSAHHELKLINPSSRVNTKTEGNGRVNVRTEANGKKKAKRRSKPSYEDI